MKRITVFTIVLLFSGIILNAQEDPAKREDANIERQRILKATDQVETLTDQISKMQEELKSLKQDNEALHTDAYKLKQQVEQNEAKHLKERDIILTEVAKSIAKVSKDKEEKTAAVAAAEKEKEKPKKSTKSEKGYEHIVEKGQTLWMIAKAYKDKGINISVEDIRKANNLKPKASLKTGQKLFIPMPEKSDAKESKTASTE